eukprot:RCo016233
MGSGCSAASAEPPVRNASPPTRVDTDLSWARTPRVPQAWSPSNAPLGTIDSAIMSQPPVSTRRSSEADIRRPAFSILHFNDCHCLVPSKVNGVLSGGVARFGTVLRQKRAGSSDCLLLFSGDCFNPSLISTVTKGRHVCPILKALKVDCAVYGNHDFDFGPEELIKLAGPCEIPWIMSNVIDTRNGLPVANARKHHIIQKGQAKIGLIGIVEEEWLATIRELPGYVRYMDTVESAQTEIASLKKQGCNMIIALTHMREENDERFLQAVPQVDLLLGGHDHFYKVADVDGVKLIKSSADFQNTTYIQVFLSGPGTRPMVMHERIALTADIEQDPMLTEILGSFEQDLLEKFDKDLCRLGCQLDVVPNTVRTGECAVGNFIADIMREEMKADCAVLNSGLLRANILYLPGILKIKDLLDIIPMEDIVVSMKIKGSFLRQGLECTVSKYPALEGRFPQVSGICFAMDPSLPAHSRITDIRINGKTIRPDKVYILATTLYLANGGDETLPFRNREGFIVDGENGLILPTMVRQHISDRQMKNDKKISMVDLRSNPFLSRSELNNSMSEVRKAFLPLIAPTVDGRIIVQVGAKLARRGSACSVSSTASSIMSRSTLSRRTSISHPIPKEHTLSLVAGHHGHHGHGGFSAAHISASPSGASPRSSMSIPVATPSGPVPGSRDSHLVLPGTAAESTGFTNTVTSFSRHSLSRMVPGMLNRNNPGSVTMDSLEVDEESEYFDCAYRGIPEELGACLRGMPRNPSRVNRLGVPRSVDQAEYSRLGLGRTLQDKVTALHLAVARGHLAAIQLLMNSGAASNVPSDLGGTARELAFAQLVLAMSTGDEAAIQQRRKVLDHIDNFHALVDAELQYVLDQGADD